MVGQPGKSEDHDLTLKKKEENKKSAGKKALALAWEEGQSAGGLFWGLSFHLYLVLVRSCDMSWPTTGTQVLTLAVKVPTGSMTLDAGRIHGRWALPKS